MRTFVARATVSFDVYMEENDIVCCNYCNSYFLSAEMDINHRGTDHDYCHPCVNKIYEIRVKQIREDVARGIFNPNGEG